MEPDGSLHNSQVPAPVPIPSQLEPVHTNTSYSLKIHLNIIFPSSSVSPVSPHPVHATPIPHTRYMPPPLHFILLNFITCNYSPSSTYHETFYYVVFSNPFFSLSFLGTFILLNTLFTNNVSLRFSLSVSDQVSHSYKTTGKIIILNTLIFKFFDRKFKDKRFNLLVVYS